MAGAEETAGNRPAESTFSDAPSPAMIFTMSAISLVFPLLPLVLWCEIVYNNMEMLVHLGAGAAS